MLYSLLTLMFIIMLTVPTAAFLSDKKRLFSVPFFMLCTVSALLSFSLYQMTGSGQALQHYELEMKLQEMGGIEVIIQKIKKRVAEHPEDVRGKEILDKISRN